MNSVRKEKKIHNVAKAPDTERWRDRGRRNKGGKKERRERRGKSRTRFKSKRGQSSAMRTALGKEEDVKKAEAEMKSRVGAASTNRFI